MGLLEKQVAAELAQWSGFKAAGLDAEKIAESLARPPKSDMGDLALGCFRFAKDAGAKPNDFAAKLAVRESGIGNRESVLIESATAAGPYVNLRLNRGAACLAALTAIESATPGNDPANWRFGDSDAGKGKTLALDFSHPNIAKPLAVHHLRSTMIGAGIKKLRESQGWRVIGINHLGDWGTGFGKLIAGLKKYYPDTAERAKTQERPLGDMSVAELNQAYVRFNSESKQDDELVEQGRNEFAVLERYMEVLLTGTQAQAGEEGLVNFRLWQHARDISLAEFERMYAHLGVSFQTWPVVDLRHKRVLTEEPASFYREHGIYVGESYYVAAEDLVRRIVADAVANHVAEESEGALVIYTHGKDKSPMILVKNDGATSYHARDMAAALYRKRHWHFDEMTYVVGGEQKLHFDQLFKALKMLGHEWADKCNHVDFGLLLFKQPDGKWAKTSTRAGTSIMLEDLIDLTVQSVREIIAEKNPELAADSAYAEQVAQAVGTGAVVFNDLKQGRRNNIKFDWDAVLDFQGESGPYMQMQYVRMCSVLDKFVAESEQRYGRKLSTEDLGAADVALLTHEEEWKIVLQLAAFPDAIAKASEEFEPSVVSRYLIELASLTSTWWTVTKDTRIVGDDAAMSLARVRLVNAIRKVLGRGLTLLGMSLVERM